MWHLQRYIYNQEEFVCFDGDLGECQAVTELGRPSGQYLNRKKEILEDARAAGDRKTPLLRLARRGLAPEKKHRCPREPDTGLTTHFSLEREIDVTGHIEVRWFRNGQQQENGVVSTGLIQNGDWTFQTLVMLETVPQSGEVYACRVEHPSWSSPVTVEWTSNYACHTEEKRPRFDPSPAITGPRHPGPDLQTLLWGAQSGSAQSEVLSGVGGFVLGPLFLGSGLFMHCRNQKGYSGVQPTERGSLVPRNIQNVSSLTALTHHPKDFGNWA
ncbi:H-2 class II histocompatibility antigen, E-S beta chain-like [Erethizon dorsatum]